MTSVEMGTTLAFTDAAFRETFNFVIFETEDNAHGLPSLYLAPE